MNTTDLPPDEFADLIRAQEEFLRSEVIPSAKVVRRGPSSKTNPIQKRTPTVIPKPNVSPHQAQQSQQSQQEPKKRQSKFKSERSQASQGIFKSKDVEENTRVPKSVFLPEPSREMGFDIPLGQLGRTSNPYPNPNPTSKPKPKPPPSAAPVAGPSHDPSDYTIDGQNSKKLEAMSSQDIRSALSEISAGIKPEFIEMLKKRGASKAKKNSRPQLRPEPPQPPLNNTKSSPKTESELTEAVASLPLSTVGNQRKIALKCLKEVLRKYKIRDPTVAVAARIAFELGTPKALSLILLSCTLQLPSSSKNVEGDDAKMSDSDLFGLKPYWTVLTRFKILPEIVKLKMEDEEMVRIVVGLCLGMIGCNKGVARIIVDKGLLMKIVEEGRGEDVKKLVLEVAKIEKSIDLEEVLENMLRFEGVEECYGVGFEYGKYARLFSLLSVKNVRNYDEKWIDVCEVAVRRKIEGWESVREIGKSLRIKIKRYIEEKDASQMNSALNLIFALNKNDGVKDDADVDEAVLKLLEGGVLKPENPKLVTTILTHYYGTHSSKIIEHIKAFPPPIPPLHVPMYYQIFKRCTSPLPYLKTVLGQLQPGDEYIASYIFTLNPGLPKAVGEFFGREIVSTKRRRAQLQHSKALFLKAPCDNLLPAVPVMEREENEELLLPLTENWQCHLLECSFMNSEAVFREALALGEEDLEGFISLIYVTGEWENEDIEKRLRKGMDKFEGKEVVEKWHEREMKEEENAVASSKEELYDPDKDKVNYRNYKSSHIRTWSNLITSRVKIFTEGTLNNSSTRLLLRYIVRPYFPNVKEGLKDLKGYYRSLSDSATPSEICVRRNVKVMPEVLDAYTDALTSEFRCTHADGWFFFVQALAILCVDFVDFKTDSGRRRLVEVEKVLGNEEVGKVIKGIEEGREVREVIDSVFSE